MLLCERGYHSTGLLEIVDAMGVPKGSFYSYFKSMEGFAAKTVRRYADPVSEIWGLLIAQGPDDDPFTVLRNAFEAMIRSLEAGRVKTGCLIGNLAGELAKSGKRHPKALRSVTVA